MRAVDSGAVGQKSAGNVGKFCKGRNPAKTSRFFARGWQCGGFARFRDKMALYGLWTYWEARRLKSRKVDVFITCISQKGLILKAMIRSEQILAALRHVDDPDLKRDLVSLGMVKDIAVDGLKVKFSVVLTTPACPLKEKIRKDCVAAIHQHVHPGAEVEVHMTHNVSTQTQTPRLTGVRNIIAVVSGKGGVGKSTIAANLAVALAASGASVALCDADIYGPSVPIMFGLPDERPFLHEVEGRDLMIPLERHGIKMNSIGFLIPAEQAVIWRGAMASKALQQLIFDTDWGPIDYFVLDMPPGTGDLHLTLVQQLNVTGVVVVTTPQAVAKADARKGAEMFRAPQINVPLLGIVENMAFFVPDDMPDRQYFLFGKDGGAELAADLGIPLLGQIPMVEQVMAGGDAGHPAALDQDRPIGQAFARLAESVAQQIAIRNAQTPPTTRVEISHA
jgi:ATP-binding protein involved in chromosome partitioning